MRLEHCPVCGSRYSLEQSEEHGLNCAEMSSGRFQMAFVLPLYLWLVRPEGRFAVFYARYERERLWPEPA